MTKILDDTLPNILPGDLVVMPITVAFPDKIMSDFATTLSIAPKMILPQYWLEKGQELRISRTEHGRIRVEIIAL